MSKKPDHERIWLEPGDPYDDRTWCQHNVWADVPECRDDPPTEYVRADIAASETAYLRACIAELENQIADGAETGGVSRTESAAQANSEAREANRCETPCGGTPNCRGAKNAGREARTPSRQENFG